MENRRLVIALVLGLVVILLYNGVLVPWLDKKYGWDKYNAAETQPAATQASTEPSSQPATEAAIQPAPATARAAVPTAPTITAAEAPPAQVVPVNGSPALPVSVGSIVKRDGQFALQLNLQPSGAGIQSVVLNDFGMSERPKDVYTFQQPIYFQGDIVSMASRSVTVNGAQYDLAAVQWSLVSVNFSTEIIYGADLEQDGKRLLEIRKKFKIFPRSADNEGFEVQVETSFNNLTDRPLTIQTTFNGPVMPPAETHRAGDRQTVTGYSAGNSITFASHPIEEFKPDKDSGNIDLTHKDNQLARWAGTESNYFGAVVLPEDLRVNGATGKPDYISSIMAHGINVEKEIPIDSHDAYLTFQTTAIKIEPHKSTTMPIALFLGPKWREVLDKSHYASYPRQYNLLLVISSGICGFCTFAPLVSFMIWLLGWMHLVLRDWGLAIIGLVAIVRVLLHPITRRSQISMAKMSKMGPEMKRLQEKYKDDKEALNKAMVDFHRQQGLGPYLGCLPMFLQTPIWIALYGVLQTTFELRQQPFLFGLTWIKDLSQPDYIVKFSQPFFETWSYLPTLRGLSLLPILMAAVMAIQQQFMPKPVAATPEQIQQQKMMQWLSPIMFLVFFYNLPSGLNLYIFTSTAIGIIESKIVRDHIKQREEAEKAGRVFVETRPTRASRQGKSTAASNDEPVGCLGRIFTVWTKLQEQADQARREQDRGGGKRKA
jgi:YidC/Oxa1 family membrane protein insertase